MITKIKLSNFRIFDSFEQNTNHSLIILSGKNAVGKTSVLESIYLCATSKSHRTNDLQSVIKDNSEFATIEIEAEKKFKMVMSKTGKSLFINKVEIKKISDFIGHLPIVLFSPSNLSLIDGSKINRRRFLDLELSILDKSYLYASSMYKKVLHERNQCLKSKELNDSILSIYTKELVKYLSVIYEKRTIFLEKLNGYLQSICEELKIEQINLLYDASYNPKEIEKSFDLKKRMDIMTKTTNIGTHRDDFKINLNNQDALSYASEGQKRTICIAISLALKKYIEEITGEEPILLLDDVFAALDATRIESITKYVNKSKQCFITTTSILEIPDELLSRALVIRIENKKEKK